MDQNLWRDQEVPDGPETQRQSQVVEGGVDPGEWRVVFTVKGWRVVFSLEGWRMLFTLARPGPDDGAREDQRSERVSIGWGERRNC